MPDIDRAIAALTYDQIEQHSPTGTKTGEQVPLLHRSIANCLRDIDRQISATGPGHTRLFAIAEAIDEALIALCEES